MPKVVFRSHIAQSAQEMFEWHKAPGAFGRLVPPGEPIRMVSPDNGLHNGDVRQLRVGYGPLSIPWVAYHDHWIEGQQFRDVQQKGPFARWEHTHRCLPDSDGAILEDELDFAVHGLPDALAKLIFRSKIEQTFRFRHRKTRFDLGRHQPSQLGQKIVVSGANGLLGGALVPYLRVQGFDVIQLVRGEPKLSFQRRWDAYSAERSSAVLDDLEGSLAWIHLSGHGILDGNWGKKHRASMWDSRVQTTKTVVELCSKLSNRPKALLCASGISAYPNRAIDDQPVTEAFELSHSSAPGFLAELVCAWEAEANKIEALGVRSVQLRLGAVLSPDGGALGQMLLPFKLGLGSTIAGGRNPFSWIALEDALGGIHHLLQSPVEGPVNMVSPYLVTFRQFADTLASVLGRPRWFDAPAALVRPVLGAKLKILLDGCPVFPEKLLNSGFKFLVGEARSAVGHELGLRLPMDEQVGVHWS